MENSQQIDLTVNTLAQYLCNYFQQLPTNGFKLEPNNCPTEVHALFFQDCPYKGCTTVFTNGLHNLPNDLAPNNRQELLFMYENDSLLNQDEVLFVIEAFIDIYFIGRDSYLPFHRFIDVQTPVFLTNKFEFNGFYLCHPNYFPEEFDTIQDGDITINFVYVAPIFQKEMDYIRENSTADFEGRLEETEECLCDLNRHSVV